MMVDTEAQDRLTLVRSTSTVGDVDEIQTIQDSNGNDGIAIYLISKTEDQGIMVLNRTARNELFRKNPKLIAATIAHTQRQQARQQGYYQHGDCVVNWEASFLPFHLAFSVNWSKSVCHHLVSVRNRSLERPVQYAKVIMPLAKLFLDQPSESHLPHLPFIRPDTQSDPSRGFNVEEDKTRQTIEHAHLIITKYGTLLGMDIQTAEATARLVNAGKIISELLVYLTNSGPTTKVLPTANKTQRSAKKNKKILQTQRLARPSQAVTKDENAVKTVGKVSPVKELDSTIAESFGTPQAPNEKKKKQENRRKKIAQSRATEAEIIPIPEPEMLLEMSASESSNDSTPPLTPPTSEINGLLSEPAVPMVIVSKENTNDQDDCPSGYPKLTLSSDRDETFKQPTPTKTAAQDIDASYYSSSPPSSAAFLDRFNRFPIHASREASGSENNTAGDGPQLKLCTSFGKPIFQHQPQSESPPIRDSQSHDSGYSSPTTEARPAVPRRMPGLKWTYATQTEADADLLQAGVWLWNKPLTYLQPYCVFTTDSPLYTACLPLFISHESTGDAQPVIEYDGMKIHIVPHAIPWLDVRSTLSHPDFLVACKLVEYQACEAAGYHISRHSRDFLYCRKSGCDARVVDHNPSNFICSGCGPKTVVRYCSFQHQIEDVEEHWKECGHPDLIIKSIVDHVTERATSSREFPFIKEKHGVRSAARHLQQVYARQYKGHYTLFYPDSLKAQVLSRPEADPKAKEMDQRIERLLNIAFLDTDDYHVLGYLYRLLQELLLSAGEWNFNTESALNTQFSMEFNDGLLNPLLFSGRPPCECEWLGQHSGYPNHLAACLLMPRKGLGATSPVLGLRAYVERLENRYWILRAAQQQHPTEEFWQRRAAGHGFPRLSPRLKTFALGPGWTGWGRKEDDICLPDLCS